MPRPSLSIVPGLKLASTTSDCATRRRITSTPSGVRRFTPTLRLPRWPIAKCTGETRAPSGNARLSILITSAPRSQKRRAASAPSTMTPKSSTRSPSRGRRGPRPSGTTGCGAREGSANTSSSCSPSVGRPASGAHAAAVDLGEARRRVGDDPARELPASDRAAGAEVLGREHVGGRQNRCDRHAARLAVERQLVLAAIAEVVLERRVEPAGRAGAPRDRLELGVLEVLRLAQPRAHRVPLARRQEHDPHVAVAAAEDRVRPGRRAVPGLLVAGHLGGAHGPHRRIDHLDRRLVQREVDGVAVAGLEAVPVRREDRPRRLRGRDLQRHLARRDERLAAGQAGPAEHAAHREQRPVGRDPVAVGPGLAEVGDREHDQGGVPGADALGAEAERRERTGPGRLDPDVGAVQQAEQPLATVLAARVDDDAALAGVLHGVAQADALVQRLAAARRRAAGRLDPDDVRAEVGEDPPAHLAGAVGHLDDANAVEGRRAFGCSQSCMRA